MAITDELHKLGDYRIRTAVRLASKPISASVLLAIGSRETNMQNICGGGFFDQQGVWQPTFTDRGLWQLNDDLHADFLKSVPGCPDGTWNPASPPVTALTHMHVPQFSTACTYVVRLRVASLAFAVKQEIPEGQQLRFAIAAHNAGNQGALQGFEEGDVDKYTTGGDYSADVISRHREISHWLIAKGYET